MTDIRKSAEALNVPSALESALQGGYPVTMPDHGLVVIVVYDEPERRAVGYRVEQFVKALDL